MPDFEATITQTRTVTFSFKAKDEDAAQEKVENLIAEPDFDADKLPKGFENVSEDADDWEIEEVYEA